MEENSAGDDVESDGDEDNSTQDPLATPPIKRQKLEKTPGGKTFEWVMVKYFTFIIISVHIVLIPIWKQGVP